jgi:non-ribosomal peptide synthetase component F
LLITLHHIIGDGWSLGVLAQEMSRYYGGKGSAEAAQPLAVQYADYARWQREYLEGERLQEQLGYWEQQLAGLPVLELPTDHPRPRQQGYRGEQVSCQLEAGLAEGFGEALGRYQVTGFMLALASFGAVLGRMSGQRDFAIGTAVANRDRRELEEMIGLLINPLALRLRLRAEEGLRELLERTREVALEGYGHQGLPFERLVEALLPERSLAHAPLFQVMLLWQSGRGAEWELGGVKVEALAVGSGVAKYELSLAVSQRESGMVAALEYNSELFEAATAQGLLERWQALLEGALKEPERGIGELGLLRQSEREQLERWNATEVDLPAAGVVEWIEQQVREHPERVAVVCGGERLSYGELNRKANRLAEYLRREGVGRETLVGLSLGRSP